jgi:peroxiredoxin
MKWLQRHPLPFPWLFDHGRTVIKAYGVYNLVSYDALKMAHPTAVLVDRQGIVRFIYRCSHQWDVPSNDLLLAAARSVGG